MIHVAPASYSHAGSSSPEDKYQSLRTDGMATGDLVIGVIFLVQTVLGTLGSFSLLYHYVLLSLTWYRPRPIDLIVKNLIVANILVLVSFGIHHTLSAFGDIISSVILDVDFSPLCSERGQGCVHWCNLPLECLPGHHDQPLELHVGSI
uniref:Vomeronasal type-1 receptor n=1 Tax=Suricata suricatta TaxID=37032 RepID=A0A673U912_SURSU